MAIHPTAIVETGAAIHPTCTVGPYACIGPQVTLGADCVVGAHAVIVGRTTIGTGNHIFHHASVGAVPQDLKYKGEDTALRIGNRNQIREFATLHLGTVGGGGVTSVGDDNLFMTGSHIAHDCRVGHGCVFANAATLAGHVTVGDFATLGGLSAVHQYARIGTCAFVSAGAMVAKDVAPYSTVQGDRAEFAGLNAVGLARRGFTEEQVQRIKRAFQLLFRARLTAAEATRALLGEFPTQPEIHVLVEFVNSSERGITR